MGKAVKVVGVNGSPNKTGNTATLIKWVLDGCFTAGSDVELLHVCDYNINYCLGCWKCMKDGICALDDDYGYIFNKLMEADGIVVGSPMYAGMPTAQLKTLIDRFTLLNLYAAILQEKMTIGVSTSGIAPPRDVAKEIAGFFGLRCGVIAAKTVTFKKGIQPLAASDEAPLLSIRAEKLGKKLVNRIEAGRRVPTLDSLWIGFLRRVILKRLIKRFPDSFKIAIERQPELFGGEKKKN